jgi:hypothetical protein
MVVGECEVSVEEVEGGFVVVVVEGVNGGEESGDGRWLDRDRKVEVGQRRVVVVG